MSVADLRTDATFTAYCLPLASRRTTPTRRNPALGEGSATARGNAGPPEPGVQRVAGRSATVPDADRPSG